jgi:hypothetical protein
MRFTAQEAVDRFLFSDERRSAIASRCALGRIEDAQTYRFPQRERARTERSPMRSATFLTKCIVAFMLAACGGGNGTDSSLPSVFVAAANKGQVGRVLTVSMPAATDAAVGTAIQLAAQVTDKNGKPVAGVALAWRSSDAAVATVSATGLLTPLRAGTVSVTATTGGSSAVTAVTIREAVLVRSKYVGTNLAGPGYWSSQFPFADMLKGATAWVSREDNGVWNAPFASMTADGYPVSLRQGQHAVSTVASEGSRYPAGRYVVLWEGEGSISFPTDIVTVVESSAHRVAIDVKSADSALWLSIDATSPTNPLHNLRFLWPGTESTYLTQPFNKEFLSRTRPFSVIRFMDWGATNGSSVTGWSDRALASDLTYQRRGVPIEVMIDLANTLRADPWFCIPHQATDDYVRSFAALLRNRLDPALRPHIEYSNEVWNTGFAQTRWAIAESERLGLSNPSGMPSLFYAQRSVEIFKLMREAYGTDSGRLVRVVAGQAAWTQFLESALAWKDTAANADVMAIAPYFIAESAAQASNVDATLKLSSDAIVDQMYTNVRGTVSSWIAANASLAGRYALKMKAYEGGSGNSADYFAADKIDAMTQLFAAANRNPRMRDLYVEYYGIWTANGGDTLNQYNDIGLWKPWGMWGALEYVTQDPMTAPKYRGLLDFIAAHPSVP